MDMHTHILACLLESSAAEMDSVVVTRTAAVEVTTRGSD